MVESSRGSRLPLLGVLVGAWAMVPPYAGDFGELNVRDRVEVVDHIIPGVVIAIVSVVGYLLLSSPKPSELVLLVGGGVMALAGLWMVATHVGLISQARQGIVPWGAVVWHGLPAVVVALWGVAWTVRFWGPAAADGAPPGR